MRKPKKTIKMKKPKKKKDPARNISINFDQQL